MSAGSSSAGEVFGWFANMTAVCGLLTWVAICVRSCPPRFPERQLTAFAPSQCTYIRFYGAAKAQGIDRSTLPYRAPLQPYAAWYGLIVRLAFLFCSSSVPVLQFTRCAQFCSIVLFFNGWEVFVNINGKFDTATFITSYLPMCVPSPPSSQDLADAPLSALFPCFYMGYRFWRGAKMTPLAEIDFFSGSRDEDEEPEKIPKGFVQKAWAAIM